MTSRLHDATVGKRALSVLRRRLARPLIHYIRRPFVLRRLTRAAEVGLLGYRLRTNPNVFDPVAFSSSRILAEDLLKRPLHGRRVLDMGTGAGPIAVVAAAAGASVTACDVNPHAVALARENLAINRLSGEVLESDLFSALPLQVFDLICFNVPFYPREPTNYFEAAYNAGPDLDTIRRFAAGCPRYLAPEGNILIVFSEDCDRSRILLLFAESGLSLEAMHKYRRLLENFHIARFRRSSS